MTLETGAWDPSACRTDTVTVFDVMSFDTPSTMYLRGLVGSSFSSKSVKWFALSTVWLQATSLLKPMLMKESVEGAAHHVHLPGHGHVELEEAQRPYPGEVRLPSSMPRPLSVASEPRASALLPSCSRRCWYSRQYCSS